MASKTLYIIGNGFDIVHGLPTKYSDFKNYVTDSSPRLVDDLDEYFPSDDLWSDFETALAYLDVDLIVENATQFLVSYGAEDWSDSYHHDYQYEIHNVIKHLSEGLLDNFEEWIRSKSISDSLTSCGKYLNLDAGANYLTFNYTPTIEAVYGVNPKNVLHIHGSTDSDDRVVLGHSWDPIETKKYHELDGHEDNDVRVNEGNELINEYFKKTFKNTEYLLNKYSNYFESLTHIETVFVLGHSLSSVDMPYFSKIVEVIGNNTPWYVTYYGERELSAHRETLNSLGLGDVHYIEMDHLKLI